MTSILITGATGFVGGAMCQYLVKGLYTLYATVRNKEQKQCIINSKVHAIIIPDIQ